MDNTSSWPSVGQMVKQAWELYKSRAKTLTLIALVGAVVIAIASAIFLGKTVLMGTNAVPQGTDWLVMLVWFVIVVVVSVLQQAALISAVSSPATPAVGASYSAAWQKFGPYLWTTILASIAIGIGFILLIIPGVIVAVWFAMAMYIVMLEGKSGVAALSASKAYVSGRWFKVFGYLLAMAGVVIVFSIICSIITGILSAISTELGSLVNLVLNLVLNLVVMPWMMAYGYLLYQALRSTPAPTTQVSPPAQPAA